jgi:hypothetical protein
MYKFHDEIPIRTYFSWSYTVASEKTYLKESWCLGTWNSVILASFYFEMYKFHDEIPIRT